MLHVQEYLRSKTVEQLTAELGIVAKYHDTEPLVILNYDQIESPKTHPVVRECRGLVLNTQTNEVVAKSFNRFFNWGEVQDEMKLFDFSDFIVQDKEDGSLCILYCFNGQWRANTRGSFALDKMEHQDFTWQEAFCKALHVPDLQTLDKYLNRSYTYICEFCSPWNKIVRRYAEPKMYLLTAFCGTQELSWQELDKQEAALGLMSTPTRTELKSIEEIQDFLQEESKTDPTFEGVVIRDRNGARWKIKSPTYLGLHKLRGEGDNVWNPKHLLPFILTGEEAELLTYFPEVTETFYRLKAEVQDEYIKLMEVWADNRHIEDQKEFALSIVGKTPFTAVLFNLRKTCGMKQSAAELKKEWRKADALILKKLKAI